MRAARVVRLAILLFVALSGPVRAAGSWEEVARIFADRCAHCHSDFDAPMGLQLISYQDVLAGSWTGKVVIPGDPDNSPLVQRIEGRAQPRMPLDGPPYLSDAEIATIRGWIAAGAPAQPDIVVAAPAPRQRPGPQDPVLWPDIQPILAKRCVKCHSDNSKLGAPPEGLRLASLEQVLAGGDRLVVLPGNAPMSELWRRVAGHGSPRMPYDGPPWLPDEDIALIARWIDGGALDETGARAPVPVGARIRLRGTLTGKWEIDGARFRVTSGTRIDKSPRVGAAAELRGRVQPDGSVVAERLRRR